MAMATPNLNSRPKNIQQQPFSNGFGQNQQQQHTQQQQQAKWHLKMSW